MDGNPAYAIGARKDDEQADAVLNLWKALPDERHFIVSQLLTGGFRVGVSLGLISRALAKAFELEDTLVVQRLMGGFNPSETAFLALTRPQEPEEQQSSGVPYPFFWPVLWSRNVSPTRRPAPGRWSGNGMASAVS